MAREMTDNDSIPGALNDRADAIQTVLTGENREAAEAAARDTLSPGMRKPASDEVENERIHRAQAEADVQGTGGEDTRVAATERGEQGELFNPDDERLRPGVDAAEASPL